MASLYFVRQIENYRFSIPALFIAEPLCLIKIKSMDYKSLTEKYKVLLEKNFPSPVNNRKTFLEIGSMPHYENVISNFYCFYFNDSEEHKFKRLFLKSLLDLISKYSPKSFEFEDYSVYTEVATKKGGRIDILIEETDESKAIIIENKIYHDLLNDLDDYWKSIKATNSNKLGILLTLEKTEPTHNGFINITHNQLINQVNKNLGSYIRDCDDRHLLFLKDIFANIQSLTSNNSDMEDTLKFYYENREKIFELSNIQEQARRHFIEEVKIAGNILGLEIENGNPKYHRCLLISKEPPVRLWVQMIPEPETDFFTIYLDLHGNSKEKSETLLENDKINSLAKEKNIDLEKYDEERDGISIASISYSPESSDFVNLGKFISSKIKSDWEDFYKLSVELITRHNNGYK